MKYFFDTEFIEGTQKKFFGETKPTIDLISIGMIDENGREFYAISKDFNLKEAWNRYDKVECCKNPSLCGSKIEKHCEGFKRVYWIRENVLRPIYNELLKKERYARENHWNLVEPFSYRTMKNLLKWNGKSKSEIANGICAFIYGDDCGGSGMSAIEMAMKYEVSDKTLEPKFYAYYSGYDWVVFCWLFGKMINLPKGFPKYCNDLKQIMDEKGLDQAWKRRFCPEPFVEHNALVDARWNKKLFDILQVTKDINS